MVGDIIIRGSVSTSTATAITIGDETEITQHVHLASFVSVKNGRGMTVPSTEAAEDIQS